MSASSEYKSKVDWWLGILLVVLFLAGPVSILVGVYMMASGQPGNGVDWSLLATGVLIVLTFAGLVWPVRYTLTEDSLLIRNGFLRSRYLYADITGAIPSRNLLSSPALSIDRIKVTCTTGIGFVLISPEDKDKFLQDLANRAQGLSYTNGAVVRH